MAGSGTAQLRPGEALLRVEHLVVEYGAGAWRIHAVSDVSFDVRRGETVASRLANLTVAVRSPI